MLEAGGGGGGGGGGFGSGLGSIFNSVKKSFPQSAPPKKKPNYSYGGGGGGGNNHYHSPQPTYNPPHYSRPAVGSTSKGTVAPSVPAPTKPPMSLDQWLAQDTVFQSSKNSYAKALQDYMAQDAAERAKYNNEYGASVQKLQQDKTINQQALNDDYASRGLLTSGLYANALNEFQNKYATQQADMERAKQAYLGDLTTDQNNFKTQQQLQIQQAQDAAAARRKATLGL